MEPPELNKADYVCAIGVSANDPGPLEELLTLTTPGINVGYVVIQRLSPDHSTTIEALSLHTSMPVKQAFDGTEIQGDHVYLAPRDVEMSVFGGRLRLRDRPVRGPSPRPITIFLQSLASDYNDRSIAVVLSGAGNDQPDGLTSVHQAGGLTLSQEASAELGRMPDWAPTTRAIDVRLTPHEIAASIRNFVRTGVRPSSVAVSRAEERFQAVSRANSLAVLVQSGTESIDVGDRYRRLTGFTLDAQFREVHPNDRERTLDALDRRDAVIPCRLHLVDGSWRHIEFRCVDSPREAITVIVDNHLMVEASAKHDDELAQLQAQMEHRTRRLERSVSNLAARNADLDSFAHAAAHDLKAPLRGVMAFSELAAEAIEEDHVARSFLSRIEQSSARMTGMIDSLLELASSGLDSLATRRCLVEPILQQVKNDLSHEIEQAGALFEVSDLDPVLADPTALGVILTNLIANSVKYRSEQTPRIDISSTTEEGDVIITIADNGIGFDQAKAVEIFEPFRRLHSRDQFEGSGVGLAICRRLANRLDGEVWATAHVNGGTAVSLRLPSAEVDA